MSLNRMIDEYNNLKVKLADQMKVEFKSFFANNPAIKGITWVQFTPHFNDGDPCCFGVNEFCPVYQDEEVEALKEGETSYYDLEGQSENNPNLAEFIKSLTKLPDEIFETAFGDHAQIVATSEGFHVSEWDHD